MTKILALVLPILAMLVNGTAAAQTATDQLSPAQKEVWRNEQDYFRYLEARDLKAYMSLWDEHFVGWPDYEDHPARKADIETVVKHEFTHEPRLAHPFPTPQPEAIEVFGDVAITHYFWPDSDPHATTQFRITHTWQKTATGWHIIGGMSCAVPRKPKA